MKTLNTYIEERLVLSKNGSRNIDIEIFDTFNKHSEVELIVGSILFIDSVKALFYFFNEKQSSTKSQFYIYTDKKTCDELFDPEYTEEMYDAGQQGRYPNENFRTELNNAISRSGFSKVDDNVIFMRTYDEIDGDWGNSAPDCRTAREKKDWIKWIKYFNKISGETLPTNIDDWSYYDI
jgi:hypothetical protein